MDTERGKRSGEKEQQATLDRLEDQISWYDKKSGENQFRHKLASYLEITIAAAIPIAAWLCPNYVAACLGALIAIVKGFESTNQWEYNWINYRSTAEKLKHEKHLFHALAGPYLDNEQAQTSLAERVEMVVSREHSAWITLSQKRHPKVDEKN